jgi:hypothetical protein
VLVTDNATDDAIALRQEQIVKAMHDTRFRYYRTAGKIKVSDCYWSAEWGMKRARGRWLCFPCDDCYYPPEWAARMLGRAYAKGADLVLCEKIMVGPEPSAIGVYALLDLGEMGIMGFPGYKPSFLVKAQKFPEWLNKPTVAACSGVDRTTLQYMVRDPEIKWTSCRDVAYFHN